MSNNPINASFPDYGATSSTTVDQSTEFNSLSQDIGENITFVVSSTNQLEKQMKLLSISKNLSTWRKNIHNINTKTKERLQTITQDFQRLNAVVLKEDRPQKLQLEKLTQEFKKVVEKFSTQQKLVSQATRQSYQVAAEIEQKAEKMAKKEQLQQQLEDQDELDRQHNMLLERQRQVEQIETDIVDVNVIMNKLSSMVAEQKAVVEIIVTTTEDTADSLAETARDLQNITVRRNSRNRKILILLLIVVIILVIVIGIIVGKLT